MECLLCLEPKQKQTLCIGVDSAEWHEYNIQELVDKHLWQFESLTSEEYVCLECWEQLNDFHNFYTQVENAHITRNQQLKDEMEANDDPLHDNDSQDNDGVEDDDIKPEDLLDTLSEPEIEIGRETETPVEIKLELEVPSIEWLQEEEEEDDENNIEMIDDEDGDPSYQIEENSVSNDSHDVVIESNDTSPKDTAKPKPAKKSRRSRSKNPNLKPKSPALLKTKKEYLPRIEVEEYDNFLKKHFKMTCEKCEETFETFRDLCTHFGEVHDEQGYVYCCGEKFVNRPLLADHVNIHLNPEYFKCVLCGKVVNKRISLINHLKLHEEKHFSCDKCDKKFIQKYLLDKHLLRHLPPSEKKFQCQECGKRYASQDLLNLHDKAVHRNAYVKICEICGLKIVSVALFKKHMERHQGAESTSATGAAKPGTKTLNVSHSEKCDECGLILSSVHALRYHKDALHPKEKRFYTCHICSKVSPNERALKKHIKHMHVISLDYKCSVCGRGFKRSENLRSHMATHTGTPLYSCSWCSKEFNSYSNMHKHRKTAHPVEWEQEMRKKYSGNLPPHFKRSKEREIIQEDEDSNSSMLWETHEVELILE